MKKLIYILLFVAISCSKSDPGPQMGCMTGLNGAGTRVLIRCCTNAQFVAGGNVSAGGIASFSSYTQVTWVATSDCTTCK